MGRQFAHCPQCDDNMEAEFRRGTWHCENCGTDITREVEWSIEQDKKRKENGNSKK